LDRLISFSDPAKFPAHQDEGLSALTNLLIRSKVVPFTGMWSDTTNQRIA
jgi:hypothetical protein